MLQRLFGLLAAGLLAASCATTQTAPSMDDLLAEITGQDGRACIRSRHIDGYGPVDESLVSVSGKGQAHYLLTTMYRCFSLVGSPAVAITGSFDEVCGGGMGRISAGEEACPIRHIYAFPSRAEALAAIQTARARQAAEKAALEKGG